MTYDIFHIFLQSIGETSKNMNILPKKSWHVRTRKNIERVRQDEAKAEELAKLEEQRVLVAEQEARINYLRNRLGLEPSSTSDTSTSVITPGQESSQFLKGPDGHINLFDYAKDHQTSSNKECDYERKREEILWQSKVGILNKLGGVSTNVDNPWYIQDHEKRMGLTSGTCGTLQATCHYNQSSTDRSKDIQSVHDPLIIMQTAQRIMTDNQSEIEASDKPLISKSLEMKTSTDLIVDLTTPSTPSISGRKKHRKHRREQKSSEREKGKNGDKHRSHRKSRHKKSKHYKHKKHRRKSPSVSHRYG